MDDSTQSPAWAAKIVGGVLLWVAVGAFGLVLWFAYGLLAPGGQVALGAILFLLGLSAIGLFCLSVGWRLFLNRPNCYGSFLSPVGWRILGVVFAALFPLALFGFLAMYRSNRSSFNIPYAVLSLGMNLVACFWCFRNAKAAFRAVKKSSAP